MIHGAIERQWYHIEDFANKEEADDACQRFDAWVNSLEQTQISHLSDLAKYASMYQNRDIQSEGAFTAQMPQQIVNVTQAIVDSLVAKQVSNESKATFDVDDGDWEAHSKAEELDRFTFGEFYRINVYEHHEQAFRDCAWGGDGWVKYSAKNGRVHAEKTFPFEMRLDVAATVSGPPRELAQVRYVNTSLAASLYPKHAAEIMTLPDARPSEPWPGVPMTGRLVRLQEGWHLPDDEHSSGDDDEVDPETGEVVCTGRRGAYMFSCGRIMLECREWKRPRFPFVRMPYSRNVAGGYSIGLVQQLSPMQRELNKLKRRKLKGLHLYAVPRVMVQSGTTCTPDFNESMGQIYTWTGAKPETIMSASVAPELVAEEQNIINQMYQLAGISPLERGSDMPSRMDSRPGMREYIAAADEKHALPSQTWNRSFLDAARCIIDVAREIVEEEGSYKTFGAAKNFVTRIDFKDVDLEDERFRMKLQNTNLLPTTPTGKRLAVLDLLKANAFPNPMDMWEMMSGDHPDVDAILNRKTSGRRLVEKQMYSIVSKRKYFAPDTHQDCAYAKSVALDTCQQTLIRSSGGYDDDGNAIEDVGKIIAMLDKYIAACDDIEKSKQLATEQANVGQQQPGGAGPGSTGPGGPGGPGAAAGAGPPAAAGPPGAV